jgi:hypothetical protein
MVLLEWGKQNLLSLSLSLSHTHTHTQHTHTHDIFVMTQPWQMGGEGGEEGTGVGQGGGEIGDISLVGAMLMLNGEAGVVVQHNEGVCVCVCVCVCMHVCVCVFLCLL